jgi:tetratricopeptide (TPR) repeat protein
MKATLWQTDRGTTRYWFALVIAAALFAGTQAAKAGQNPVDLDKAIQAKTVQDRSQSYYHYALSKWYEDDGDLDKALSEMQLAVRFNEADSTVHVALADILAQLGRMSEATDAAQKASQLDPKNPEPHWLLASVYLRQSESGQGARGRQASGEALDKAVQELEAMKAAAPNDQRAYFALGACYLQLGQPEKAIAAYERWQVLVPDSDAGYASIAQYYDRQGNQEKAIQYLQKAVEAQPDSVQSLALLASLYSRTKRDKEAIPLYRKILTLTGGTPEIKRQLASTLLDSGDYEEAGKLLGELSKDDPQDTAVRIMTGRAQIGAHQLTEAIATLKSTVASDPDNIEAKFYLGAAYEQGGQAEEAIKIFSALVEQSKNGTDELKANRPVFQQHLAACLQDLGDYRGAIAVFEEMSKGDPAPRNWFLLINAYRLDRQYDKAQTLGKQQLEKNPKDVNIAMVYARSLADAGKAKEGAEILNRQLLDDPGNLDLYVNLSQIYVQAKRFGEAEKVLRRAEEQKLDKEAVKMQLASVYERQKDFDRAETLFKEILKADPRNAVALNYLGYMLADRGIRLDEAVQYVQQALDVDPNNGAYLDSLGWAFYKKNDLQKAEKYLLQAVDLVRNDPVIQDHVGDLYFKTGNLEKAQEFWKKSLNSGGEPEDAQKVREKLEKVQETLRKQKRQE